MTSRAARRRGFTLVELLVAMALAITLLGLAVTISQTAAFDSYRTVGAADKVSQWLIVAKNRATRDRQVRGLRLLATYQGANQATVSECQYVEAPDPWTPQGASQVLVFQQVIDEGDPRVLPRPPVPPATIPPAPHGEGLPVDQKRVLSTRVFLCGTFNGADFEFDGVPNPAALVRAGDTLYVPELGGRGFRVVGITNVSLTPGASGGAANVPAAGLPTFDPGRRTATYPNHFHPGQPQVNFGGNPYPPAVIGTVNPHPTGQGNRSNPMGSPVAFGLLPGEPGNNSTLTAAIELQLADAPSFAPGYSKFVRWTNNAPPIISRAMAAYSPNPVYETGPFANPMNPVAVELPFGGDPTAPTPGNPGADRNPLNFQAGQFADHRYPVVVTKAFGFYRTPRPLLGEANLPIPGMVIDLNLDATKNPTYSGYAPTVPYPAAAASPVPGTTQFAVDILFAPNGEVINAPNAITALLIRDANRVPPGGLDLVPNLPGPTANPNFNYEAAGSMALVVIYTRTGSVATKPVADPRSDPNNDPFAFVKDGINGGL